MGDQPAAAARRARYRRGRCPHLTPTPRPAVGGFRGPARPAARPCPGAEGGSGKDLDPGAGGAVPGGDRGGAAHPAGTGRRLAGDGGVAGVAEVPSAAAGRRRCAEDGEQAADVLAARLRDLSAIRAARGLAVRRGRSLATRCSPAAPGGPHGDRPLAAGARAGIAGAVVSAVDAPAGERAALSGRVRSRCGASRMRCSVSARCWAACRTGPTWTCSCRIRSGSVLERRAAFASTLLAGLELARGGDVRLRQEHAFGPILVRRVPSGVEEGACTRG